MRRASRTEIREEAPPSDPTTVFSIPSRDASTRAVRTGDALSMSMIYRAVAILSTAVKQLSIDAYRGDELIDPAPSIIRRPNIDDALSVFIEETVISNALAGNAYWLIDRDSQGTATNLEVLNPLDVEVKTTNWGRVTGYQYKGQEFRPEQIKHLKLLRVPGQSKGLGPIQAAQTEIRGAIDTRDFAGNWFPNSGVPVGGYLSSDQRLNPEDAKAIRDAWTTGTANRDGVPVLGSGLGFHQTFLSPKDALWIEAQQFSVTQIARLFGVPASLMLATVEGNSQSYANVEQDWLAYTRFTLMAYLTEIEEAISDLLPRGTRARFNVEALLRADTTTRYAAHAVALASGFMTVDEIRAIEHLPPLPAGAAAPSASAPATTPKPDPASEEEPID